VGVFAMLYISERRLWVWLAPTAPTAAATAWRCRATASTLDTDREFEQLRGNLWPLSPSHEHHHAQLRRAATLLGAPQRMGLAVRALPWRPAPAMRSQRYSGSMDGYEKGILLGTVPAVIWLGWFWGRCAP
jgi:hypothetical protein